MRCVVTTDFASKSSNSPFVGNQLQGVIAYTICDGEIVYQADKPYFCGKRR
jgi:dihydroorotase